MWISTMGLPQVCENSLEWFLGCKLAQYSVCVNMTSEFQILNVQYAGLEMRLIASVGYDCVYSSRHGFPTPKAKRKRAFGTDDIIADVLLLNRTKTPGAESIAYIELFLNVVPQFGHSRHHDVKA
jgi:hypothetical protein